MKRRPAVSVQNLSLALLVVQNSLLIMTMRWSRVSPTPGPRYLVSTAVVVVEVLKLGASLGLATHDLAKTHPGPARSTLRRLGDAVLTRDAWRLAVPAALYTAQNSLIYVAVGNMDAVSFQATYQLKILTTVLFSMLLLGRAVTPRQWMALVLLALGVAVVQAADARALPLFLVRMLGRTGKAEPPPATTVDVSAFRGLLAAVAAAFLSGLTCVYVEKMVKDGLGHVSLWTRNVQLSFFSLFPALLVGVVWYDGAAVWEQGFFAGYGSVVWATVLLQALGGLLVAVCMAHADNVAKNFAASLSIVLSCVAGAVVFREPVGVTASCGTAMVLFSVILFQSRGHAARPLLPLDDGGDRHELLSKR